MTTRSVARWIAILFLGWLGAVATVPAGTLFWDAANTSDSGAASGGTGTWDTVTANWWNSSLSKNQTWTNGADDIADFNMTVNLVTVSNAVSAAKINSGSNTTITNGTITLTGIHSLYPGSQWKYLTIYSCIQGTAGLVHQGGLNSVLNLYHTNNSYTGGTTINGPLCIAADGYLGPAPADASGTNIVFAGANGIIETPVGSTATCLLHPNRTIAITGTTASFDSPSGVLIIGGRILSTSATSIIFGGYQNSDVAVLSNAFNAYTATNVLARGAIVKAGIDNAFPTNSPFLWTIGSYNGPILDLNGHNQSCSGISCATASSKWGVIQNSGTASTSTLTVAGTSSFGGILQNGGVGKVLALAKTGVGTLTLSWTNSYTGPTQIMGGTLALTGSGTISSSAVITVSAGAVFDVSALPEFVLTSNRTLQGGGSVAGNLNASAGGAVSPGVASPGTLSVSGNATLAGRLAADVDAAAGASDLLAAGSNLTLGAGSVLVLVTNGSFASSRNFTLATYGGVLSGTFGAVSNLPPKYKIDYGAGVNGAIRLVGPGAATTVLFR